MADTTDERSLKRRLAWFFGIALASGLAVTAAAEILRWLILH